MRTLRTAVGVIGVILLVASVLSMTATAQAQPTSQPAPWTAADEQLAAEAKAAYEAIKPNLQRLDHPALAKTLADNRRPMLPRDQQTDEAVAAVVEKMKKMGDDLDVTRQLLADVDALKPAMGPATTQNATVQKLDVVLVKIPLLGTRELAEKNGLRKGGWTSDDQGNLAVLMVRHDDVWYWQPFGW